MAAATKHPSMSYKVDIFSIPAGSLNRENSQAAYVVPGIFHSTDSQATATARETLIVCPSCVVRTINEPIWNVSHKFQARCTFQSLLSHLLVASSSTLLLFCHLLFSREWDSPPPNSSKRTISLSSSSPRTAGNGRRFGFGRSRCVRSAQRLELRATGG